MLKFADDELLNVAEEEDESIDVICHSSSIKARLALFSDRKSLHQPVSVIV